MDRLTIIISNYNQEKHISETIDSVFNQVVDFSFKVLITDDYSCDDRSREAILDFSSKYSNIVPLFADEHGGYLTNILRAKLLTKTKYFCLLDADDYWTDKYYLQRSYDFLEAHHEYCIYEANVEVISEDGRIRRPFISCRYKSGTYSKEMLLNYEDVPITQTTGMFFRNSIFINGIPEIMKNSIGTRSEKAFEGDTGRFFMHLKEGLAYYDKRIVGVYRLSKEGIWSSLSEAKKSIITARMFVDYYYYFDKKSGFFVNSAYVSFQRYLAEKYKELSSLTTADEYIDEDERLMANDVFVFCKQHESEINKDKNGIIETAKQIYRIYRILRI